VLPTPLTLAVRVFPEPEGSDKQAIHKEKVWRIPTGMLVFDTETRVDSTQRLTFGSYRFYRAGLCVEEGLFYADDLPTKDRAILKRYVAKHKANVDMNGCKELLLLSRLEFLKKLYDVAYKGQGLLVGFNLPFDLSRIAATFGKARGRFAGGFSLGLWTYRDAKGCEIDNGYRPRVVIKLIDSKRALKGFTSRRKHDPEDILFESPNRAGRKNGSAFRGHMLDPRTLAFALTDRSYSLQTACTDFDVEHGKEAVSAHGIVTERYVDYNRRDVLATSELTLKLVEEYAKHPI
jgi:hypothetical protein